MLELKNVSKFYYKKGMITTGFSKVNLKFDMGEFIAITGESGSGKSTLLNVISGLDSYEEGEMYINGQETSYYSEKDYEKYRKKYIGNIFQNFNLVNSYTVYQNIELIYLINGFKAHEVKEKINNLIKQVDLVKYKNRKVSKLSGGQKQRVAIARALAQNTPIILADEPTGNLDKKSSENVLKILHDISKDKLVIVVTHNYDQIEEYVTRKITMSDGKVIEDKQIKKHEEPSNVEVTNYSDMKTTSKAKLGIRNAFNILSKFLIITFVYTYVVFSLFITYGGFVDEKGITEESGYNNYFDYSDLERVVIYKKDRTLITDEEYAELEKLDNISKIVKKDLLLDQYASVNYEDYYIGGRTRNVKEVDKLDYGRMPENDYEVILKLYPEYYDLFNEKNVEETLKNKFELDQLTDPITRKPRQISIVGVIYSNDLDYDTTFFMTDNLLNELCDSYSMMYNTEIEYSFLGSKHTSSYNAYYDELIPDPKVKRGKAIVSDNYAYSCKNFNCKNYKINITSTGVYSTINKTIKVSKMYNKKNFKKLTSYTKFDDYNGAIFINEDDYNELFDRNNYQSSVYIKDKKYAKDTLQQLNDMGYKTLYLRDTMGTEDANVILRILNIVKLIVNVSNVLILFFVSYFVIKLVIKSRNIYYSTLRILGSSKKDTEKLLNIELFTFVNIAYLIFITIIILTKKGVIDLQPITVSMKYLEVYHYVILYLVLALMSLLTTARYSRKLFVGSVMNTYREEV